MKPCIGKGESAGYLLVGPGGEWEIFRNSSNSDEFDENQSDEKETEARLNHHRVVKHAYKIDAGEEHAIIQTFGHT